jgi:glycosyltransferase involved in cell wall biosynthesis
VLKFPKSNKLYNAPVIATSESELWNKYDNERNWILTAGKIENLRIVSRKLHSVEIPANAIFSFWKHVGYPGSRQGFVEGREVREGCLIATRGGGLCQISNALYDSALKAGFEILERHKHTKVIEGSLAEKDRDATVKWNYVDLRFRSKHPFRIEIEMTTDKLIAVIKSEFKNEEASSNIPKALSSKLNDCFSCGNTSCFKHPDKVPYIKRGVVSTYILDEKWSEHGKYLQGISSPDDYFLLSLFSDKKRNYNWSVKNNKNLHSIPRIVYRRSASLRWGRKSNNNLPSQLIRYDNKIAKALVKKIPVESTHLVIAQNLLPFVWNEGVLGGRTFDVLMTRLPMEKLHERLDYASTINPESKTLIDFRAPQALIDLENIALTRARKIITPHKEIADIFKNKSILLEWDLPIAKTTQLSTGNKILFPASALGRKGAYEVKKLAQELNLTLVVTGRTIEEDNFWTGVKWEKVGANPLADCGVIVYPAYVEHQPRFLLKALSSGIPVIASSACGLAPHPNLTIIPTGDYEALKREVMEKLKK